MRDLGLLAAHVRAEILGGDGIVGEPELALGWDDGPG
jgi:hypothetical protein